MRKLLCLSALLVTVSFFFPATARLRRTLPSLLRRPRPLDGCPYTVIRDAAGPDTDGGPPRLRRVRPASLRDMALEVWPPRTCQGTRLGRVDDRVSRRRHTLVASS